MFSGRIAQSIDRWAYRGLTFPTLCAPLPTVHSRRIIHGSCSSHRSPRTPTARLMATSYCRIFGAYQYCSSWRMRMLNRRMLLLAAGKATVLVPAMAAGQAFPGTSSADVTNGTNKLSSPTPDEVRCQALCLGRAALARRFRESGQ